MNPADVQLIEQIGQATQGGSRLLCTLARRGKVLERDEPQRARFLLDGVRLHPLYKGGRLAFDMLEIEDLMLERPSPDSMSTGELIQVLSTDVSHLPEALRRMGLGAEEGRGRPATDVLAQAVRARVESRDVEASMSGARLPRVSLGPSGGMAAAASAARDEGRQVEANEPELQSSDYLFDYVVLGFLDVLGLIRVFPPS